MLCCSLLFAKQQHYALLGLAQQNVRASKVGFISKERRGRTNERVASITAKTFPKLYENEKLGSVILLMTLSHGRIPTMIKVGINVA